MVFFGDRRVSTAQPPARTRAVAWRTLPSTIWLAGSSGREARGGAIIQIRRGPQSSNPPR